jgi:hypothetical protein
MKMKYWSEHDKYIVMVHGEGNTPKGIRLGYQAFLDFKRVKDALIQISTRPGNTYSHGDDIYKRTITQSRAVQILEKLDNCRWDNDIRIVANQIGAGDMLSPISKATSLETSRGTTILK